MKGPCLGAGGRRGGRWAPLRTLVVRRVDEQGRVRERTTVPPPSFVVPVVEDQGVPDVRRPRERAEALGLEVRRVMTVSPDRGPPG
jgi:hypothetical protein